MMSEEDLSIAITKCGSLLFGIRTIGALQEIVIWPANHWAIVVQVSKFWHTSSTQSCLVLVVRIYILSGLLFGSSSISFGHQVFIKQ